MEDGPVLSAVRYNNESCKVFDTRQSAAMRFLVKEFCCQWYTHWVWVFVWSCISSGVRPGKIRVAIKRRFIHVSLFISTVVMLADVLKGTMSLAMHPRCTAIFVGQILQCDRKPLAIWSVLLIHTIAFNFPPIGIIVLERSSLTLVWTSMCTTGW